MLAIGVLMSIRASVMNAIKINKINKKNKISILLVEDVINSNSQLKQDFVALNYTLCGQITSHCKLSDKCTLYQPDILVVNTLAPTENILKALASIDKLSPLPVLIFAKKETQSLIQTSIKAGVSAYIVNDIQPHRLNALITVARERFKERQLLRAELKETKMLLANRKIVERAKGYIMDQKQISEEEAFKTLRKMAMNNGQSITLVAKNVIDVYQLLQQSNS